MSTLDVVAEGLWAVLLGASFYAVVLHGVRTVRAMARWAVRRRPAAAPHLDGREPFDGGRGRLVATAAPAVSPRARDWEAHLDEVADYSRRLAGATPRRRRASR